MYNKLIAKGFSPEMAIAILRIRGFFRNNIFVIYAPHGFGCDWHFTLLGFDFFFTQDSQETIGNKKGIYIWFFSWHLGFIPRK